MKSAQTEDAELKVIHLAEAFPLVEYDLRKNAGKNCYECAQGFQLNLNRACEPVSKYYFKTPCVSCSDSSNNDVVLKIADEVYKRGDTNPITVTFWIKIFGFSASTALSVRILQYSSQDFL